MKEFVCFLVRKFDWRTWRSEVCEKKVIKISSKVSNNFIQNARIIFIRGWIIADKSW